MGEDIITITGKGLTHEAAAQRLKADGYNELPSQRQRKGVAILTNVLREPMLVLLVAAGALYILLGNIKDALMLSSFIVFVVGVTYYQEHKTERALSALKNLSSPRALVIRSGQHLRIPGREVVREDVFVVNEGDRVPADGYVLSCVNFLVDESLLTGESLPVRKKTWDGRGQVAHPGGDDTPCVYSGTLAVGGRAVVQAFATGAQTQMGRIGTSLAAIVEEEMLLRKETGRIVARFALVGVLVCAVVVVLWGVTRGNWLAGALAGLTLSMSMLPEEFPVVLTIFLTLGAWRLSKRQVLVRHLSAIETLGAATVLCVDKTGTLTENSMRLVSLWAGGSYGETGDAHAGLSPDHTTLLEYAALACEKEPFDPLEKEIWKHLKELPTQVSSLAWELVREYPKTDSVTAVSFAYQPPGGSQFTVSSKGSPETIGVLCRMGKTQQQALMRSVREMADRGLRVLGVARATYEGKTLPDKQQDFSFTFLGLLGFADPVRSGVPQALAEAYTAGIRVIMLTGDYPGTAQSIAKAIGLTRADTVLTGEQISDMNHTELREKMKSVNVFARILPEQKLFLVNALKANGEIVVMTGDGVNDAPALKAAHIGIAMGGRGTDVAREAADIVLIDDNFSSIVRAVRTGRKIYENIRKATSYILAVHVPIAGMTIFPILLGLPIVLMPAHIAFLELIIDPACSTVFEAEHAEADVMKRPPRHLRTPLLSTQTAAVGLMQGVSVLGIVFLIFVASLALGVTDAHARTLAFTTMVFGNMTLIITNLSWKRTLVAILHHATPALRGILVGVSVVLGASLYVHPLRDLFHFSALRPADVLVTFAAGAASLLWFEILKMSNILRT